jgi:hypothetical protein
MYVDTFSSTVTLHIVQYGKVRNSFTVADLTSTPQPGVQDEHQQWPAPFVVHVLNTVQWIWPWRSEVSFLTHNSSLIMSRNVRQISIAVHSMCTLQCCPNCQDNKKRERQRNCHSKEELKETLKLNKIWCPIWHHGTEKWH